MGYVLDFKRENHLNIELKDSRKGYIVWENSIPDLEKVDTFEQNYILDFYLKVFSRVSEKIKKMIFVKDKSGNLVPLFFQNIILVDEELFLENII